MFNTLGSHGQRALLLRLCAGDTNFGLQAWYWHERSAGDSKQFKAIVSLTRCALSNGVLVRGLQREYSSFGSGDVSRCDVDECRSLRAHVVERRAHQVAPPLSGDG